MLSDEVGFARNANFSGTANVSFRFDAKQAARERPSVGGHHQVNGLEPSG